MSLWILLVLTLYPLGWSRLAGPLNWSTAVFLAAVAVVFLVLALRVPTRFRPAPSHPLSLTLLAVVLAYFIAAYLVNGGVPVVQIALGRPYDLYGFGIPHLHVVMLTLTGYLGVRSFRRFLENRERLALASLIVVVFLLGSIANRSAVSFLVVACVYVYLRSRRLTRRHLAVLVAAAVVGLYAFGWFGNLRLSYQLEQITQTAASGDEILRVAGASQSFIDSGLSPSFLWGYTYLVSPVANLNEAIGAATGWCGPHCDLAGLGTYEFLPDVVALKVGTALDLVPFDKSAFIISPSLTASTTFGSAVGYAGLLGASLMVLVLIAVSLAVVRLSRGSDVREEALAILATFLFFGFFENMWSYSALSLQLVFPLLHATLSDRWVDHPWLARLPR